VENQRGRALYRLSAPPRYGCAICSGFNGQAAKTTLFAAGNEPNVCKKRRRRLFANLNSCRRQRSRRPQKAPPGDFLPIN
jgi:hypothetical protein